MKISQEAWIAAAIWVSLCVMHLVMGWVRGNLADEAWWCLWLTLACFAVYWAGKWWWGRK